MKLQNHKELSPIKSSTLAANKFLKHRLSNESSDDEAFKPQVKQDHLEKSLYNFKSSMANHRATIKTKDSNENIFDLAKS